MHEVTFVDGPFGGQTGTMYGSKLKVAAGFEYGWVFRCGHGPALAFGEYLYDGVWVEPERDVRLLGLCDLCDFWMPEDDG